MSMVVARSFEAGSAPLAAVSPETAAALALVAGIHVIQPLRTVLCQLAAVVREAVPGVGGACVVALHRDKVVGIEFAGPGLAAALDERQFAAGFGPCLEAARRGRPIALELADSSPGAHQHHPGYSALARRHGVRRTLSLPLIAPAPAAGVAGSLTLFTLEVTTAPPGAERATADDIARDLARAASAPVVAAVVHAAAVAEVAQLREAMASRAVIEQAKGVIMARDHCTAEQAFDRLRESSMRSNRKLRDVAVSVVRSACE